MLTPEQEMRKAIYNITPHVSAWRALLEAYIKTLPEDRPDCGEDPGSSERSYAERELKAMKRTLAELFESVRPLPGTMINNFQMVRRPLPQKTTIPPVR